MLKAASQSLTLQGDWIKARRAKISSSLAKLDSDFGKIAAAQ
jgi:DNA-binding transcriptional regulator PaaX